MPVLIAGMHRSGTSMVTKILNQCGLYLGADKDLAPPGPHNPDGYWENVNFVKINEELLNEFGGGWDHPPIFPPNVGSLNEGILPRLRAKATLLLQEFKKHTDWGWKDPRNSLTFRFWQSLLGDEIRVVVCVRNPLEVARSLHERNSFSYANAMRLWRDYYHRLVQETISHHRIVTHYECYFRDPVAEINRLAEWVRLSPDPEIIKQCAAGIKEDLRHFSFQERHLVDVEVAPDIIDLYHKVCAEAACHQGIKVIQEKCVPAEGVHYEKRRELNPLPLEVELSQRERESLQIEKKKQAEKIRELEGRLLESKSSLERANKEIRDLQILQDNTRQLQTRLQERESLCQELIQLRQLNREQADALESMRSDICKAIQEPYRQMIRGIRAAVSEHVPAGATIAVVSRGDEELLKFKGRTGWHFPRSPEGLYAGAYPADSEGAIGQLELLRMEGAGYLLIPQTAMWWLDHYQGWSDYLSCRYRAIAQMEGVCQIFALCLPPLPTAASAATAVRFAQTPLRPNAMNILFLLPVPSGSGGVHSVVQEALDMRRLGTNAQIAVDRAYLPDYARDYPDIGAEFGTLFYFYSSQEELNTYACGFDVVIGTIYHSLNNVQVISQTNPSLLPAYYIQDYEPWFFTPGSPERLMAHDSYTLVPGAALFAKTDWLCDLVRQEHGVMVHKVSPSIDTSVFFPVVARNGPDVVALLRSGIPPGQKTRVRLVAMIRPRTTYRGATRTSRVLQRLVETFAERIEIHIFGCDRAETAGLGFGAHSSFTHHGILTRQEVANLYRSSDVFLDLSDWQAFGRTGLEAMACGCVPIVPEKGGSREYAVNGENALIVDTNDEDRCYGAAHELVADDNFRERLRSAGILKAAEFSARRAALSELEFLSRRLKERRAGTVAEKVRQANYAHLVAGIGEIIGKSVPQGASVAVVSRGDDRLLGLPGQNVCHFPQGEDGNYLGYHPADSGGAITHLESVREKGINYLVFPTTSLWWLDFYAEFGKHLDSRYQRICANSTCLIFDLSRKVDTNGEGPRSLASASGVPLKYGKSFNGQKKIEVRPPAPRPQVKLHTASANVIVCIHNALADVQDCLQSLLRNCHPPATLILVDDGSDDATRDYLREFANTHGATLIRNDKPRGYTFAANQGLRQSTADFVVLLNSDTVTTPMWLDRMIACANSDAKIGLVGPLSNTASWQSVPALSRNGDWAENPLPDGASVEGMAERVALASGRVYPRLPFLNGFCLLIRRVVLEQVGYFDEDTFGQGYGEENDYCMRSRAAGWELAVADDAFVLHRQSRSYSHERRRALCQRATAALEAKHGQVNVQFGASVCRHNRFLEGIRCRVRVMDKRHRLVDEARSRWSGRNVIFVLPVTGPNGGCKVIFQEAKAMRDMGIDAVVLNLSRNRDNFEHHYPFAETFVPVIYVDRPEEVSDALVGCDVAVATINSSVEFLPLPNPADGRPIRAYYVQDFEPYFYVPGSDAYTTAWKSYDLFPDLIRLTKTEWNRSVVKKQIGVDCHVVGPSVDIDLYRPWWRGTRIEDGPNPQGRPVRIAAMLRPSTPRRAPKFTLKVLEQIYRDLGPERVEISLFGCSLDDPGLLAFPQNFPWQSAGVLNRSQMATFLNDIDVFADLSAFQAMGLTALEAMACGAAVVLPREGGCTSFSRHEENALLVDTNSQQNAVDSLRRLVEDPSIRWKVRLQGMADACQHFPEQASYNMLEAIFGPG